MQPPQGQPQPPTRSGAASSSAPDSTVTSVTSDTPTLITPQAPTPFGARVAQPAQQRLSAGWQRFRGMSRMTQVLLAGAAVLALMVCSCCACVGLAGALGGGSPTAQRTATTDGSIPIGSQTHTIVATTTATAIATAKPTATRAPTPTPKPRPTAIPTPTCIPGAVNCNPWGYNFSHGSRIYNPPSGFCGYFECIASFWNGSGYVVQCQDSMYSKSGGRTGSCSRHGGEKRTLLAP